MARFSLQMKRRKPKAIGGFHAQYIDKQFSRYGTSKKKNLGLSRTIGSAVSLILGGFMFYISLHYIPAYLGHQKIIALSNFDNSASRLAKDDGFSILSAYIDPFRLKRTYLRAGQSIQVQYAIPEGSVLEINIIQCQTAFIYEIFKCEPVTKKTSIVRNDKVGSQRFKFKNAGFY